MIWVMRMTLTEEERKELDVISDVDCSFMMGDASLSHAISALKSFIDYMEDTEDESISDVQKILNRIRDIKEENKKKWTKVRARVEELWEKDI